MPSSQARRKSSTCSLLCMRTSSPNHRWSNSLSAPLLNFRCLFCSNPLDETQDFDLLEVRTGQIDIEEGARSRQLGHGGLLGGSRSSYSTIGTGSGAVMPEFCRMLDAYLRHYNEMRSKGAGLDQPNAISREFGAGGIAGPKKHPHPRLSPSIQAGGSGSRGPSAPRCAGPRRASHARPRGCR